MPVLKYKCALSGLDCDISIQGTGALVKANCMALLNQYCPALSPLYRYMGCRPAVFLHTTNTAATCSYALWFWLVCVRSHDALCAEEDWRGKQHRHAVWLML